MKTYLLIATLAVATTGIPSQDPMEIAPPAKLEQHAWLQQLCGEWTATSEATLAPGAEPMRMESTESVRPLGDCWIVAQGHGSMQGMEVETIMQLGYDPAQKAFVGTWIDNVQTHLWIYRGQLDEAKKVLTLETEGPSFDDPAKLARYRDVITLESTDRKTLTSSALGDEGKWTTFLKADYARKK